MIAKLAWGLVFAAGWWFVPKSLGIVQVLCLLIGVSFIVRVVAEFYRRHCQGVTTEQAFDLVNEVLQPGAEHPEDQFRSSWCKVLQVYANKIPSPVKHLTEDQQATQRKHLAGWGKNSPDYSLAVEYGLIAADEYDSFGSYALTEMGSLYAKVGPMGGYEFYLNELKQYRLEDARSTRRSASATFVLEFERTKLAVALKHMPVLRRTFDLKTERTDSGEWLLTELIETGLPSGPQRFPLDKFRNWQAHLEAQRKEEAERGKWHDEPDVKAALARYQAETDPEKKALLSEDWQKTGEAARQRLGIN